MEENLQQEIVSEGPLTKVTTFSKYLAMILFITLPFIGGYIGYMYAPEKIVEVEKLVVNKSPTEKLFQVSGEYREASTVLVNGDPIATIERDFPSSNTIIYQSDDKLKTFFKIDDSAYYYSPCVPLYYLDLNYQRYYNFQKDYCPTDGMGIGVENAQAALPIVFQYGKMKDGLYALNLETEQETLLFSTDLLASNESLVSKCVEGNYDFLMVPDMEVTVDYLRIGIYEKRQLEGLCTKEEYFEKLRDVTITY